MSKSIIDQAIKENKTLFFTYTKYNGEISNRSISNIQYLNDYEEYGYQNDHISGFCHKRNENRTFKISRMSNISFTSKISSDTVKLSNTQNISKIDSNNYSHNTQRVYNDSTQNKSNKTKEGCYIATMAYGSYEHPQVLILRNYRDEVLINKWWGNTFIKAYYSTSPILVKYFKRYRKINLIVKQTLDIIIKYIIKQ